MWRKMGMVLGFVFAMGGMVSGQEIFVSQPQSTPHPYLDNTNVTYTYSHPGATGMKVRFTNFDTERCCDFVYILDKNNIQKASYHGTLGNFDSVLVPGDTIKIRFTSDGSVTKTGFDMPGYLYTTQDLPPSPPTSFTAAANANSVSLTWTNTNDTDFASVTIRRSTSNYPETITNGELVSAGITGTSYTDQNLNNATYYYSIFSIDTGGNISTKATTNITVDGMPFVSQPQSTPHPYLNNTNVTYTYSHPGATGMKVRFTNFDTERCCDFVYILDKNNIQKASYHGTLGNFDSVLVPGDTIKIRFTSDGSVTKTGFDMPGYLYTTQHLPPASPSITATKPSPTGNTITMSWNTPTSTSSFKLERSLNGGAYTTINNNNLPAATTTYTQSALADGIYTYRLSAIDSLGNASAPGLSQALTIDTTAPASPSITATKPSPTGNTITMSWNTPASTSSFRLERSLNGGAYTTINNNNLPAATTRYIQSALADGIYTYRLSAIDSFGNVSAPGLSQALTIDTTAPAAPTLFSAVASGNSIALTWTNPVSDFDAVLIRVSTVNYPLINTGTIVTENSTATEIQLSGLNFNTTYTFSIFATDTFGNLSDAANTSAYTQIRVEDLANTPQIDSGEITIDEDVTTPIVSPQIGVNGTASVNIQKSYSSSGGEIGVNPGSSGTLTLSDPTSGWTDTGDIVIGKNGEGKVLQSSGTVSIAGTIVIGKETGSSGNYTLSGGTLSAGAIHLENAGSSSFTWTGGTLQTESVIGNLDNQGGTLVVSSDKPLTIAGNYSQNASSQMQLTLTDGGAGMAQLSSHRTRLTSSGVTPLVSITGDFDAGNGTLTIALSSFNPVPNTVVTVFSSPPRGTFSTVNLPDLDTRLRWDQSQLYSSGILTVVGSSADLLSSRPLNAPNPFKLSEGSMLGYYLNEATDIELRVYRSSGNEIFRTTFIKNIHEGAKAGYNRVMLSKSTFGQDLSAGIYPYILISNSKVVGKGKFAIIPE